ncbi:MAG: hypothetical protein HUJ68_12160, partial [Clostridia bacterium]|nr:hypothetical protein [Clostridia bacterium]
MKKIRFNKIMFSCLAIIVLCLFALTSCGNSGAKTLYAEENRSSGCSGGSSVTKYDWIESKISKNVEESVGAYLKYVNDNNPSNYDSEVARKEEIKLNGVTYTESGETKSTVCYKENLKSLINSYAKYQTIADVKTYDEEKINQNFQVQLIYQLVDKYITFINGGTITTSDMENCSDIKASINGSAGCFDTKTKKHELEAIANYASATDVYYVVML